MSKQKTKYPNIYFDDKRNKYEYRKMINGSLLFGRADTPVEALKLLIDEEARNTNDKFKKKKVLPDLNSVLDNYLKDNKNQFKTTSLKKLNYIFNKFFRNKFRLVPIDKLIDQDFKKFYRFLEKQELSIKVKNAYLNILKRVFEYVNLQYNYDCLFIKRLKSFKDYSIKNEDIKETHVISFDDLKKIYNSLDNSYNKLLLLTLFIIGDRAGEILALNPSSFDFEKNTIKLKYAATWKGEKTGFQLIQVKSKSSKRIYPMPDFYKEKLLDHINKYNIGKKYKYIFFSKKINNQPICSSTLDRIVGSWSNILGYRVYPHLFRHTTASQMNSLGVSVETIKSLLGHSSTEITKQFYIHDTKEKIEAVNLVVDSFFKKLE